MIIQGNWKIAVERVPWGGVRIWVHRPVHGGEQREVLRFDKLEIWNLKGGELPPDNAPLQLGEDEAKSLALALAGVDIRTDQGAINEGALAAVRDHLKDMQRLVFEPPLPAMTAVESTGREDAPLFYRNILGRMRRQLKIARERDPEHFELVDFVTDALLNETKWLEAYDDTD